MFGRIIPIFPSRFAYDCWTRPQPGSAIGAAGARAFRTVLG